MNSKQFALASVAVLVLLVTACAPQAAPTTVPPTAIPPTEAPTSMPATEAPTTMPATEAPAATSAPAMGTAVKVGQSDALGSILVDDNGMALYLLTKDSPNSSTCYGQCAASWPALLTTNDPIAGEGVNASKLGTTTRNDGSVQVTYNGWPLYYYAKDSAPGDVKGEGVGNVWYAVSPAGDKVEASTPSGPAYGPAY